MSEQQAVQPETPAKPTLVLNSGMEEAVEELERRDAALVPVSAHGDMMGLLELALSNNAAIDVIERLVGLRERELARVAEIDFNEAMNRVQDKIKRIAPDLENTQKNSRYASYAAIDRVIRPIYGPEGFSISFTHADCPKPDHIRVICWLRRKGHKEPYQVDWPVDMKGPKGGDVMTATQATGASDSYAKRYLVKDIFNIAIGDDDTDGNAPEMPKEELEKAKAAIRRANNPEELKLAFTVAFKAAQAARDRTALADIILERDKRRVDFEGLS